MNVMPLARMRPLVLNVDDDAANRYVKTRSLMMGEMEVIEAATGGAALALIAERQPLLVLLAHMRATEFIRTGLAVNILKAERVEAILPRLRAAAARAAEGTEALAPEVARRL